LAGLGLVDGQGAALELGAVHRVDGRVAAIAHLDEAEAAGAPRLAVVDDLGAANRAVLAERLNQVVRGGLEGEVPHVDGLAHVLPSGPRRPGLQAYGR